MLLDNNYNDRQEADDLSHLQQGAPQMRRHHYLVPQDEDEADGEDNDMLDDDYADTEEYAEYNTDVDDYEYFYDNVDHDKHEYKEEKNNNNWVQDDDDDDDALVLAVNFHNINNQEVVLADNSGRISSSSGKKNLIYEEDDWFKMKGQQYDKHSNVSLTFFLFIVSIMISLVFGAGQQVVKRNRKE